MPPAHPRAAHGLQSSAGRPEFSIIPRTLSACSVWEHGMGAVRNRLGCGLNLKTQVSMGERRGVWKGKEGPRNLPTAGIVVSGEWSAAPSPSLPQCMPQSLVFYSAAMQAPGAEALAHSAAAHNSSTERSPLHPSACCWLAGLSPMGRQQEMESREGAGTRGGARHGGFGGGPSHPSQPSRNLAGSATSSSHQKKHTITKSPVPFRSGWKGFIGILHSIPAPAW